ncbi:RING/U-box superfamily protein [Euphorbia peplus]|nr:RING/U-box superfamily protein [Euphorbia peplus]
MSYYADDEDGNRKRYSQRGPFRHKFLKALLPFWSSAIPTLPFTVHLHVKTGQMQVMRQTLVQGKDNQERIEEI